MEDNIFDKINDVDLNQHGSTADKADIQLDDPLDHRVFGHPEHTQNNTDNDTGDHGYRSDLQGHVETVPVDHAVLFPDGYEF